MFMSSSQGMLTGSYTFKITCHKASYMNSVDVYHLIPITYFLFYLHVRQVATNVSSYTLVYRYDQLTMNATITHQYILKALDISL